MLRKLRSRLGLQRGKPWRFLAAYEPSSSAGPLETIFASHSGRFVTKWQHYLPIYDRLFLQYKEKAPRLLEIGVLKGGSLQLWRQYFGPRATVFGIDIDQECSAYDGEAGQVRIGSQDDPEFLRKVVAEMGGLDIVLDDGSHVSRHMQASFETLFPLLSEGGLYVVEDTHACYWRDFEGGYRMRKSFIEFSKRIVDDLHHWYHPFEPGFSHIEQLVSVQFFDSMIVFEKGKPHVPAMVDGGADRRQKTV